MNIGVGVEGPSDRKFWSKVLNKHFPGNQFDIRSMKSREQLLRDTPDLVESFRDAHYLAGIIIIDRDRSIQQCPCPSMVIDELPALVCQEAKKEKHERFLQVCVAIRGLESWYLSDENAINSIFPSSMYIAPEDTATINPKELLEKFWKATSKSAFNKLDFAEMIAPKFDPLQAVKHSKSFQYFWTRLNEKLAPSNTLFS